MKQKLQDQLKRRVLVFDGAMGTTTHAYDLDLQADYEGRENCTEVLVRARPDVVGQIHESFLAAGADAVETNTFGANRLVLGEFELADQAFELNKAAAEIARAACDKYTTADKPRFAVGSIGPGTKLITLGNTHWAEMFESYRQQVRGLIAGGVDALLIETAQDLLQVKCTINACLAGLEDEGKSVNDVPIMVQVTIETSGTMLLGTEIAAAASALAGYPIMSLGMNCATGPAEMREHLHWLCRNWPRAISVLPNAGLPKLVDGQAAFPLGPLPFAEAMLQFVEADGVNIVGGCCGTTPEHIAALAELIGDRQPATIDKHPLRAACTSLYAAVEYRQDASVLNIGERLNASGSRRFKRLLEAEDFDAIISLGREQVREGSHVIDVNVDYAGRDNAADMADIVQRLVRQVNVPLMLDSTQPETIEAGLGHAGGKCIINSANLEDGESKFALMCGLAKKYNAALVLGTIDEDPQEAMARTADRKEAIATRMYELAVDKYGLDPGDLLFDPLVLPISTGMEKDRRSGLETIEGVRRISQRLWQSQTVVGLSNVSFGLKPAVRMVLNSAFMAELVTAGLTGAIVHVSKILPQNKIDERQWAAALDLIYDRRADEPVKLHDGSETTDPLQIFIDLFADADSAQATKTDIAELPLEERLQKHIIDGEKQNLIETLEEALGPYDALAVINDHLLAGMKVVGELFGSGKMQLPFVLQSAEVMKMAVSHLEQYMEKIAGQTKGSIVLATVKGDVHDIGKNLVDIILSNNGYTVYNLGIKQPIGQIVAAWREHQADAIGLSGLLVKSVAVMEENLQELNAQGVTAPVLLGGAALSRSYCESHLRGVYEGRVYYGGDAFEGLALMDQVMQGQSDELDEAIDKRVSGRTTAGRSKKVASAGESGEGDVAVATRVRSAVATDMDVPAPPFWGDRVVELVPPDDIYPLINKVALFRGQWQFKRGRLGDDDYAAMVSEQVEPIFERLKADCRDQSILQPKVVYGYFPCQSDGDELLIYRPPDNGEALTSQASATIGEPVERFGFPRQPGGKHLCISDFFRPVESGEFDVVGMTCVTVGSEVTRRARAFFEADSYSEYLYLHGFGVEAAEALAEFWHRKMRTELGIAGDDGANVRELFKQRYRGSRYSFGYPACPDLSDQAKLFRLLRPHRIGCELTENWQIDPEQSTSAMVVHHPEAKYFGV